MYLTQGMGCADCGGCCKGMGSIDLSTLSWEDYFLIGIVGTFVISEFVGNSKPKRRRKKSAAVTFGGGSGLGAIGLMVLAAAGYFGYLYFSQSPGGATS